MFQVRFSSETPNNALKWNFPIFGKRRPESFYGLRVENENPGRHQNHGIQINMTGSMANSSTDTGYTGLQGGTRLNTGIKIKNKSW